MPILGASASGAKSTPVAPTIGTATDAGSGRAYNNGSATVTFTAPTSKLPITSYTVTSSPGGFTTSGASSPLTVTGLQSATAYTFTVTATSSAGTSPASSASNSITATTVPQAPTIGSATAGNASATVTYTAGATGGAAISTFTATSSPSSITGTGASPITVSGLSNGTAYTFTVTATNTNGTSTASSATGSVTPVVPNPYPVGSTGPGGGKVFYDAGSVLSWGRYMESAPQSLAAMRVWSDSSQSASTNTAIGTGKENTNLMNAMSNGSPAASYCTSIVRNGKSDWYLPSKDEMVQLGQVASSISAWTTPGDMGVVWTSSQISGLNAWAVGAVGGSTYTGFTKTDNRLCTPVRRFTS